MRVVKAYAQEENEISAYALLNKAFLEKNRALVILRSIFFPLMFILGGTCVATILWIGGRMVIQDELTLGQFVAFNGFLLLLIFPMIAVGWVMDLYQRGTASMKRINEILAIEPEIQDLKVDWKIRNIRGEIEFRGLNFAYNGRPVLRDIDLRIPAGAFVGLVGRVGCGKTTFARLIPRMIKGGPGQVLIDGVDIERIPLRILRNHIGFVPHRTPFSSQITFERMLLSGSRRIFPGKRLMIHRVHLRTPLRMKTGPCEGLPMSPSSRRIYQNFRTGSGRWWENEGSPYRGGSARELPLPVRSSVILLF